MGLGPREAGSRGERRAGRWIKSKLESLGYEVVFQSFEYGDTVYGSGGQSQNYIAEKKGTQDKTIVIAAHYDSAGLGSAGTIDSRKAVSRPY
ncbi:MAG: hypothetical protein ACFB0D_00115 [Phormidesmis sp.]